jgi:hypothetical protein
MTETKAGPDTHCDNCGAPHQDGLAACAFCDFPIVGRSSGIRCPSCSEISTADRRSCAQCSTPFTKGCVFCGRVAFLTATACPGCNEAFAGAEQRKKQQEEAAKQQQVMGIAQQGIAMLGAVAMSDVGRSAISSLTGGSGGASPVASKGQGKGKGQGSGILGEIFDAVIHSNDKPRRKK